MVFSHQIIDSNNQLNFYKETGWINLRRSIDVMESILTDDQRIKFGDTNFMGIYGAEAGELKSGTTNHTRAEGFTHNLFLNSDTTSPCSQVDGTLPCVKH